MQRKIISLTFLSLFIFFFIVPDNAYAKQKVNPDRQIFFSLKRIKEKIILASKFSNKKKFDYLMKLSIYRFEELEYIIQEKNIAFIETSSDRFQTNINQLIELIKDNNLLLDKAQLRVIYFTDINKLTDMQNSFRFNSAEWRFVQDSINTLNNFISVLN